MKKTMHCYVSGRVQGVCFRMYTEQQAQMLGLGGWVRNLPDGRVELKASGDEEQLNQLRAWLKHGPELAMVLDLDCEDLEYEGFDGFMTRY